MTGGTETKNKMRLKKAQKFDLKTEKWSDMPDMNKTRIGHATFRNSNYLYAFGGRQDTVERIPLLDKKGKWELIEVAWHQNLSKKYGYTSIIHSHLFSSSNENSVYIFGGEKVVHPFCFNLDNFAIKEMSEYTFTEDLFYGNTVSYNNKVVLNGMKNLLFVNIEDESKNQKPELKIEKKIVRRRYPTPKKIQKI